MIISAQKEKKKKIKQVCCWRCKETHKTLFVVRDEDGKKTNDYTCDDCKAWGDPEIGNSSRNIFYV